MYQALVSVFTWYHASYLFLGMFLACWHCCARWNNRAREPWSQWCQGACEQRSRTPSADITAHGTSSVIVDIDELATRARPARDHAIAEVSTSHPHTVQDTQQEVAPLYQRPHNESTPQPYPADSAVHATGPCPGDAGPSLDQARATVLVSLTSSQAYVC
jgi:hypothetical protein